MVEIIYENPTWLPFFESALKEIDVEVRLNYIDDFELDVHQPPDDIVYLNRVSPSSHTRGHANAVIRGEQYLTHLQAFNRQVINDIRTIDFEMSKVNQYQLLKRFGLGYPVTYFASEIDTLINLAERVPFPLLTKHNRSGKGLGIYRFDTVPELKDYLHSDKYEPSPDGILLLQEYIKPLNDRITRVEIMDGQLVYAFHSATSQGFELCPADACRIDTQKGGIAAAPDSDKPLFNWIPDFDHPIVRKYIDLCKYSGFDMAGIEFVQGENGALYTYDINGTTNYSPDVERQSGHKARRAFQEYIKRKAA